MDHDSSFKNFNRTDWWLLGLFVLLKILIHLLTDTHGAYGYFRDELYYLDCARHLDWGYVDQPPLSILILAVTRALFGTSLLAIRLPVMLIGAATVVLTGLLAGEMGGGRFARCLACLAVLTAPIFLAMGSFFSMNAFDQFFWVSAGYVLVRLIKTENPRLWLWFGLIAGLGLENKTSIGFFGVSLVAAMAATPLRRHFRFWQFWAGGSIAALLLLPHLLWQIHHDWPTLEFMRNASLYKNMPTTLLSFFTGQLLMIGPLNTPVWLAGLLSLFLARDGRRYAVFGIVYLLLFVTFHLTNGKVYYLSPAYPLLLAPGAVWLEKALARRRWAQAAAVGLLAVGGMAVAPLAIPVLAPEPFLRYQDALGMRAPQQERAHSGALPQHLGDRLGWEEFVALVADAYARLEPADRAKCAVLVSNYGEAGAINQLGARYGLPRAISGYMNYYLWGPGDATGEVLLAYWPRKEDLVPLFDRVDEVARFHHPYVMARQNDRPLFLCRGLKIPLAEAWKLIKTYY
ncbi:MAG: glycosyltransferase family 39 protein [Myxococcales bacterium]|nr:glycosyltransferase family 39 protein [Myxococcales bacterium]